MNYFPNSIKNILITGGSGFIGSAMVTRLLNKTSLNIFNLDKLGYANNEKILYECKKSNRYIHIKADLTSLEDTTEAIKLSNPDLVFHFAAESHVDTSINNPKIFLDNNINGTFNLLEALVRHWESIGLKRKKQFRLLHISTDEVFGSLGKNGLFSENSPYSPRSPYSATKAASDHLVKAWNNTYGLPILITNSSNNYGPRQLPEKLIPVIIKNAISNKEIPIYGDGTNIRDWIFVEDNIDALIKVILYGKIGQSYCIGGGEEKTNNEIVDMVCQALDNYNKKNIPHIRFKKYIIDRKGHDERYAVDYRKIQNELNWSPSYNLTRGIDITVKWYLDNLDWPKSEFV